METVEDNGCDDCGGDDGVNSDYNEERDGDGHDEGAREVMLRPSELCTMPKTTLYLLLALLAVCNHETTSIVYFTASEREGIAHQTYRSSLRPDRS